MKRQAIEHRGGLREHAPGRLRSLVLQGEEQIQGQALEVLYNPGPLQAAHQIDALARRQRCGKRWGQIG